MRQAASGSLAATTGRGKEKEERRRIMINEGRRRMKGTRGKNREINKRKKKSGKCKKRRSGREIKGKKKI